jgi:hypothetical protein
MMTLGAEPLVRKGRSGMGGVVLDVGRMSLRGPKAEPPKEPKGTRSFGFRCPPHIREYLDRAHKDEGRDRTEIILFALELDRDLGQFLSDILPRIASMATKMQLDPRRDLAKVLAVLVRFGLEKAEADMAAEHKRRK